MLPEVQDRGSKRVMGLYNTWPIRKGKHKRPTTFLLCRRCWKATSEAAAVAAAGGANDGERRESIRSLLWVIYLWSDGCEIYVAQHRRPKSDFEMKTWQRLMMDLCPTEHSQQAFPHCRDTAPQDLSSYIKPNLVTICQSFGAK